MPRFKFAVGSYEIKQRRRHEDTNYITAALSVNNQPIGSPQTKFMGNQNNGTYPVGFSWPDVDVPEGGRVTLFYEILNSGHKDHAGLEKVLTVWAGEQQKLPQTTAPVTDLKGELIKYLTGFAVVDCDGPITPAEGRKLVWDFWELKGIAPGTTYNESVTEHGNNSPTGCGKNSHYIVNFSVTA